MAIKRQTDKGDIPKTKRDFREALYPFVQDESGIKALRSFINSDNTMSREGMYLLEILNNIISSNHATEKLYQRIPSESFRGLPEGGRRNVQASLIARGLYSPVPEESGEIQRSGYTVIQEAIGQWAEKDGCWSDTPDADLVKRGYINNPNIDGSEAHIFDRRGDSKIYKTIDCSHFSHYELMLDRIAIHNATFPEMAMKVEGFGVRDDALTNRDFVVIISQEKAIGRRPTEEEIEREMSLRGYDKCLNGLMYISILDNTLLADISPDNAVITEKGNFLCYDSEPMLKFFGVNRSVPEKFSMADFLPSKNGKLDGRGWHHLLGANYDKATEQEKSALLKELRFTGQISGLVDGRKVIMSNPLKKVSEVSGKPVTYFDGPVLVGSPASFRKEHTWEVKPIQATPEFTDAIQRTVRSLTPMSATIEEFLYTKQWVGEVVAGYGGGELRKALKEELRHNGRLDGLLQGKYIVQLDPTDKNRILIQTKENIEFMLWTNSTELDGLGKLTPQEKIILSEGRPITKGGKEILFNLDRGRLDSDFLIQKKLSKKQSQDIDVDNKRHKTKGITL